MPNGGDGGAITNTLVLNTGLQHEKSIRFLKPSS